MIDEKLILLFLNSLGINDLMEPSDSLKTSNIALIANRLKYWKFEIITTAEWESSQVSIGGINTKEIESLTLESKIIPGLFLQVKSWMLLVKWWIQLTVGLVDRIYCRRKCLLP